MLLEAKMVLMFGEIRREWKQHGEQVKVGSGVPVTFWFLSGPWLHRCVQLAKTLPATKSSVCALLHNGMIKIS